ncbi:MAG: hypothetical protein FJY98_00590 [Candidatus Liptonbacteria bacterium]|nr:hypothetical protein [Candidatus Liptonbacteria bacterium]
MKREVLWVAAIVAIGAVTVAPVHAETTPSAVIKDVYQSHEEINTFSCADESKCSPYSTDHFDTATTVISGDVMKASFYMQYWAE